VESGEGGGVAAGVEAGDRGDAGGGVGEGVEGEFGGVEGVAVAAKAVGFAYKAATVFEDEAVVGADVVVRGEGEAVVVEEGEVLVAEEFFPVGGFVEAGFLEGFAGDDEEDGEEWGELSAEVFGEVAFAGGVDGEGAGSVRSVRSVRSVERGERRGGGRVSSVEGRGSAG